MNNLAQDFETADFVNLQFNAHEIRLMQDLLSRQIVILLTANEALDKRSNMQESVKWKNKQKNNQTVREMETLKAQLGATL